ncbi:tripartite tricarboxylate transporter permease [Roseicyclus sp. F158]|uniref:Tripartite tricarboxylate transporter permease n=1 Tax=Tropicimonas omnivorans TaxID=3075590 RepID=A0ABU3DE77_9RHOB|nr:tripartite tricarboxylate transporter permease [Roseicyclus sp. F158]MDT0682028.1 tripartite tricarboxylate transporter permease [Roseicyclus sp. F158]
MVDLGTILMGLGDAFHPMVLVAIVTGVALSQFVGALPGVGPVIVMAIAIPYTLTFEPLVGIAFLVGSMKGGSIGGAIPAIILNTPGTPDTAMTTLDGHPMARKGQAKKALKMATWSSVTGDTVSDLVLITVAAPLAFFALRMGPVEIFALMVLAFAVISALSGRSLSKALIAAALGIFVSLIGTDPDYGLPRLTFGNFELFDGVPQVPVAIGVLVLSEIVLRLAGVGRRSQSVIDMDASADPTDDTLSFREYWACRFVMLRGAFFGTMVGALPGIGSSAAASMSYVSAKAAAKDASSFGKGDIRGVASVESANSAVAGANLIPLLALGIPGSVTAALVLSAFMVHGIQPGPLIFENQGRLIYGLFGAMMIANVVNLGLGLVGWRIWVRIARAPETMIFASAIILCIVGSTVISGGTFGLAILLGFTVLGVLMKVYDYPVIVFIIAFFLGPRLERSLGQTLSLLTGDLTNIVQFPVAIALLAISVVVLAVFFIRNRRDQDRHSA